MIYKKNTYLPRGQKHVANCRLYSEVSFYRVLPLFFDETLERCQFRDFKENDRK